jgi:hypothetical protein
VEQSHGPPLRHHAEEVQTLTILGVYGANSPSEITNFESYLGRDVDAIHGVVGMANWWDFTQSANWMANDLWKDVDHPVLWSVPLLVWDGNPTLAQAASGQFNNQYESVAESLLASRSGDNDPIYIRTGWEMNIPGFPWASAGHEQDFIGAFRQFVDTFRDVSDRFKFEWNVNHSWGSDPMKVYPGDNYVDVIGMDIYWNVSKQGADANTAWNYALNAPYGLKWLESTADAHGKPTAYSEWGVDSNNSASYIKNMEAWFESHDVVYQSYWNSSSNGTGKLSDWHLPNASEAYREAFGDESDNAAAPWQPSNGSSNSGSQNGSGVTGTGGADVLNSAGGGNMQGLGGNDVYYVSSANDKVIENQDGGVDTVRTWIQSYTLPGNVENLTLTGTGWSAGTGNWMNNTIIGNDAANRINGAEGSDTLTGGGGADTFVIAKGQGRDTVTDFHPHSWGGAADALSLEGFGNNAHIWNNGNLFSIQASDGSVTQVMLHGVTSLSSSDYAFH